jgi:hypothetical protein
MDPKAKEPKFMFDYETMNYIFIIHNNFPIRKIKLSQNKIFNITIGLYSLGAM